MQRAEMTRPRSPRADANAAIPAGRIAGPNQPALAAMAGALNDRPAVQRLAALRVAINAPDAVAQRIGNPPATEDAPIAAIYAGVHTAPDRVAALEASNSPELAYGTRARQDEELEIAASASYLHQHKINWRAEFAARSNTLLLGRPEISPSWEKFQRQMDQAAAGVDPNQPPWFMAAATGYQVTGANQALMNNIGTQRANTDPNDPQQRLGMTYSRDTMFTIEPAGRIARHMGIFDATSHVGALNGWTGGDVLRVWRGANEVFRLRIHGANQAATGHAADVDVLGTVLAGPNITGFPAGSWVVFAKRANGWAYISYGMPPLSVPLHPWTGRLESYPYYQARTVLNEGLGLHLPAGGTAQARNRGPQPPLDDARFAQIHGRLQHDGGDVERGYNRTLGPTRTRVNFHDPAGTHHVGWDANGEIAVAPYRRLGGDNIFAEAPHAPGPRPYQNLLHPAHTVNLAATDANGNATWYHNQARNMPGRFVGGRSNSTALYMSSATLLYHSGWLARDDCMDVLAFVIADMVVSGEHSMPECMTTVVMAAGSTEPWSGTPLRIAAPANVLSVWLKLVPPGIKAAMKQQARDALTRMLGGANPHPDPKMVKLMAMIVRTVP